MSRQYEEWSMSKPDHTRVIRFAEAQAGIPGPGGERSISFLQRGSLDVKLSRPLAPNQQTPTHRTRSTSLSTAEASCFTKASANHSRPAIAYSSPQEPSIVP